MQLEPMITVLPATPTRLDVALAASDTGISRREAKRLLAESRVLVNDHPVAVASRIVNPTDRILVIREDRPLNVLGSTSDWIAIDKPSGLASQMHRDRVYPSALELLAIQLRASGEPTSLYPVHRLDTPTSGVLLFARNAPSAARLSKAFASGEVRKTYLAVLDGKLSEAVEIDQPIRKISEDFFGVSRDGRRAVTRLRPLETTASRSLAEVEILTGRTHQIRVHASHVGHPVTGDRKYGGSEAPRLMLHAWKLEHALFGEISSNDAGPLRLALLEGT